MKIKSILETFVVTIIISNFSPVSSVSWYRDTMLLESDNNIYFRHQGTLHTMTIRIVHLDHLGRSTLCT